MFLLVAARSAALLSLLDKSIESIPDITLPEDVALARMLASTVIRRQGEIDASLARFYDHKGSETTRMVLRLGVAQLAYTRIPDRAAIHATVELAKDHKVSPKLVNAILRQVQRAPLESDPRKNASPWLLQELGDDRFLEAVLTEPHLDVTCRSTVDVPRLESGSARLDAFLHLDCWAQDPAAACAARVLIESVEPGTQVLDACAAPGGKTLQLVDAGLTVVAVDRSAKRLERLYENLERLKMTATVIKGDITRQFLKKFRGVLVDAPCTCIGTARRRPDVLRKTGYGDVLQTQSKLLRAAYDHLEPGGVLVYSTCSVLRKECEEQIDAFLLQTKAQRWPLQQAPRGFHPEALTTKGDLRIMPWHLKDGACDGHYVARVVKPS